MRTVISIIIPTLNEERALPATLNSIHKQISSAATIEIIVIDGGSTDKTLDIVKSHPHIKLLRSAKGRAVQMNEGVKAASGEWLLFLHADTLLPAHALNDIKISSNKKYFKAGCFHQQFSKPNTLLKCISFLHNWRFKKTHIMYGDQAIFIRHSIFNQLGGFPEETMEDIKFSEKLLEVDQPIMLESAVITDSRKFKQRGVLRSLVDVVIILIFHQLKQPTPKLSKSFFSEIR